MKIPLKLSGLHGALRKRHTPAMPPTARPPHATAEADAFGAHMAEARAAADRMGRNIAELRASLARREAILTRAREDRPASGD